jgi:hypothetical protein
MKQSYLLFMWRCNDVVVGGTKQSDSWDTTVDDEQTQAILERAAEFEPTLKASPFLFEVLLCSVIVTSIVLAECCSDWCLGWFKTMQRFCSPGERNYASTNKIWN